MNLEIWILTLRKLIHLKKTHLSKLFNIYQLTHWNREFWLSRAILEESKKTEHLSLAFDSILQFDYIMKNEFMESYKLSDYNQNKISNLFWNFCYEYLRYSNC